jgi:hypothetical protein
MDVLNQKQWLEKYKLCIRFFFEKLNNLKRLMDNVYIQDYHELSWSRDDQDQIKSIMVTFEKLNYIFRFICLFARVQASNSKRNCIDHRVTPGGVKNSLLLPDQFLPDTKVDVF